MRLEFVFSFFLVSRADCRFYACARRWRRWRGRGGGVSIALCVWSKNARATRRVGFGGASGRAASETAPRRSAQHRVRLDAFVLHELQRYRFGYKNFWPMVRLKKCRRLRLIARACNRVFQKRSEARARAGLLRTLRNGEHAAANQADQPTSLFFLCGPTT